MFQFPRSPRYTMYSVTIPKQVGFPFEISGSSRLPAPEAYRRLPRLHRL